MIDDITPLILTYNEEPNIGRTLERLNWAKEIVVVDSGSTDETLNILARQSNARVLSRPFDNHGEQWNFGLENVNTPWVLALDADYILSDELIDELSTLTVSENVTGLKSQFVFCVFGEPLKTSLLPPHIVLFRKTSGQFYNDGHTQRLKVEGTIEELKGVIFHDDRKSFDRWLWAQQRYMKLEAEKLMSSTGRKMRLSDRIRQAKLIAPILIFFYTLFFQGLILQGWKGIYYSLQRTLAELLLSIRLIEAQNCSDK